MAGTAKSYVPSLSGEVKTATGTSHAETLNAQAGIITTESLTTAAAATESRTLTNNFIQTGSMVLVWVVGGGNTRLAIIPSSAVSSAGSATISLTNAHASSLNGTVKYAFLVL